MIEERQELMVPPNNGGLSVERKARFLKPILSTNQNIPRQPSPSLSSNPSNIVYKKLTKSKKVVFKGRVKPQKGWKSWVEKLEQTHDSIWKKVGIFDAIKASTYDFDTHDEILFAFAEKWCVKTNTFVFPWGEATVTLEDVMILGGFSVLGACVRNPPQKSENDVLLKSLVDAFEDIRTKTDVSRVSHCQWMGYFKGRGGELENVALIVLWLSRFVLSTNSYLLISENVFPIAVSLAGGDPVALAPAVLASIYRDLSLLSKRVVNFVSKKGDAREELVLWAPLQLVQLWAWERFPVLLGRNQNALLPGEPRAARWHGVQKPVIRYLREEIESSGDNFMWRPYGVQLENWRFPKFYCDKGTSVVVNSQVDEELLSFVKCLRCCELVGVDCIKQYLPHRVGMQFGLDQDLPAYFDRCNRNLRLAWSSYDKCLDGSELYLPPRLLEGDVTVRYSRWWRKELTVSNERPSILGKPRRRSKRLMQKLSEISDELSEENGATSYRLLTQCDQGRGFDDHMSENVTEALPPSDRTPSKDVVKESNLDSSNALMTINFTQTKVQSLFDSEMNEVVHMDEEPAVVEDAGDQRVDSAPDDVVIVVDDDEEENERDPNPIDALCLQLEARIRGIEIAVSTLRVAEL